MYEVCRMIYDFAAKIKGIQNENATAEEALKEKISAINQKAETSLEIKVMLPDKLPAKDVLIKTQISVSSLAGFHEEELSNAIVCFKSFIEDLAEALEGEVSKAEGFYNNSKTFSRLYT
jgi:hypothetical protein